MGRSSGTSAIASLPPEVFSELEEKARSSMTVRAIAQWLGAAGHTLNYQAVARHVRKVRSEVSAATSAVTLATAVAEAELDIDLIGLSLTKLFEALADLPEDWFLRIKPSELFLAIARMSTVEIQQQRFQQDMKDRMMVKLASVEGRPGIDLTTLKEVREKIYGIFDDRPIEPYT
jgi:hypothetical protein